MQQRFCVGGALVCEGKLLIVRRSQSRKAFPGHYETPGGGIELGEDPVAAVKREVMEEVGLTVVDAMPYFTWGTMEADIHFVSVEFRITCESGDPVLSDEHDDLRWVTRDELDDIHPMTPQMRTALQKAFDV